MCPRLAVHRTILVVDVERFGDRSRTNLDQLAVRAGLYRVLEEAFRRAGIGWSECHREDRGDGVLVLAPAEMPKSPLVDSLPSELADELSRHNLTHCAQERIRLRAALHAGEVNYDDHGVTAESINMTFRLLDSLPLREALGTSSGVLALIVSSWFFNEVVRHSAARSANRYRPVRIRVKETTTVAWVCLPDHPYPPLETTVSQAGLIEAVPQQLPIGPRYFAGRVSELDTLMELLDTHRAGSVGPVVISAIDGTAGIGKTALAVHWAHAIADGFPDGQLYVNLRGFDPSAAPMTPAEAIRGFLGAFQIPPERIPASAEAQASLYRSLAVGRRMLVLLDNARDAEQVRPLLPGTPSCLVIITSRNKLTSLIAAEGAHPLTLDLLSTTEAIQLLTTRLGPRRVTAEATATDTIVELCAHLPLALAIVAARAIVHPNFPLTALAEELREEQGRLDALNGGDDATDMRAVLSWSYQQLSPTGARLFRLLGLHGGPDITAPAAASLAGLLPSQVRPALIELSSAHLVDERVPGRFAIHDLLRAYANEQTHVHDRESERLAAVRRVLDHYLHSAYSAALMMHLRVDPIAPLQLAAGVTPIWFPDYEVASSWCEAEHKVLLAAIKLAAASGHHSHAWQLPWMLTEYLDRWGHWHDLVDAQLTALVAAESSGDIEGQAHACRGVGRACLRLGHYGDAHLQLGRALDLFDQLGDCTGQAHIHVDLAFMLGQQGNPEMALEHAQSGLQLACAVDNKLAQARALNNLGWYHSLVGDPQDGLAYCQQGLILYRELNDPRGEAYALHNLAYAYQQLGEFLNAVHHYQRSISLKRAINDRYRQAMAMANLGDTYHAMGNLHAATTMWEQALENLDYLGITFGVGQGYPNPRQIRDKLKRLRVAP